MQFKVQVEYPAYATYEMEVETSEEAIAKARALDASYDADEPIIDYDAKAKSTLVS